MSCGVDSHVTAAAAASVDPRLVDAVVRAAASDRTAAHGGRRSIGPVRETPRTVARRTRSGLDGTAWSGGGRVHVSDVE